jgi:glycosyltransferase involved in cell wall biosynthesis
LRVPPEAYAAPRPARAYARRRSPKSGLRADDNQGAAVEHSSMPPTETLPARAGAALTSLAVLLPCRDEAPNVAAAVAEATRAAGRFAHRHEILVIDDGSADETRALATELARHDARVRVVAHERNLGYGAAVRSGIAASTADWILLTDGDLQFDLGELQLFLGPAERCDLVAGYRLRRADPPARRLAAHAWNGLMRRSFGVSVRDVDCAFKLMRGPAARALPLESDGAMVSTELLVRASLAGWRIAEVGVHHRPRLAGEPSGGDIRVIARAFRERRALLRRLRAEQPRRSPAPQPTIT